MANTNLFATKQHAMTRNEAGGLGYALTAKQQLAQDAATGCISQTFYASDADQLERILTL